MKPAMLFRILCLSDNRAVATVNQIPRKQHDKAKVNKHMGKCCPFLNQYNLSCFLRLFFVFKKKERLLIQTWTLLCSIWSKILPEATHILNQHQSKDLVLQEDCGQLRPEAVLVAKTTLIEVGNIARYNHLKSSSC